MTSFVFVWNERNVGISWQELQNETDFCDVTLACEDKQIKTHKVIISSCSPVFQNILKLNQNPNPLIYLRKVKYNDLQNLLTFMYQGEVNVAEEDLSSFLEVAEELLIRGLSEVNKESYNSSPEELPVNLGPNTAPSPKRKKPVPNDITTEPLTEFRQTSKHTSMENNKRSTFESLTERQTEVVKQEKNEEIDQCLVSMTREKSFVCVKCDKQFSGRSGLHMHTKSVHEGVVYSCDQCDYKGAQNTHLKKHIKTVHQE